MAVMSKEMLAGAKSAQREMEGSSDLWKPDPGIHFARVLKPIGAMESRFFIGYALHWGLGMGAPVPCPRRMNIGPCPICTYAASLPEDEAKPLWPSWSAYMNVMLVDEDGDPIPDDEGNVQVKVWRVGRETLGDVMNAIERESKSADELVDITDPEEGIDLRVKRTGKTRDDTKWDISLVKRGPSDISEYAELYEPEMQDLTEYVPFLDEDGLRGLLLAQTSDPFAKAAGKAAVATSKAKPKLAAGKARVATPTTSEEEPEDGNIIEGEVVREEAEEPVSESRKKLEKLLGKKAGK